jgi:hypothetical protein
MYILIELLLISDSARKRAKEDRAVIKFPELTSVIDDEQSLEYLIQREEFETNYPSDLARQPTNEAAWARESKGSRRSRILREDDIEASREKLLAEEINAEETVTPVIETVTETVTEDVEEEAVKSEFERKLDESRLKTLLELRAERETRRSSLLQALKELDAPRRKKNTNVEKKETKGDSPKSS